ncbi:hypothetical protein LINGRAHAP2_LOCUS17801 [Linum grandiflorum]
MIIVVVLLLSWETATARPLVERINIQSLQRGPVTPSRSSPCGHVPNRGTGKCTLGGMNVAGEGLRRVRFPPAPVAENSVVVEAGVVSNLQKEA